MLAWCSAVSLVFFCSFAIAASIPTGGRLILEDNFDGNSLGSLWSIYQVRDHQPPVPENMPVVGNGYVNLQANVTDWSAGIRTHFAPVRKLRLEIRRFLHAGNDYFEPLIALGNSSPDKSLAVWFYKMDYSSYLCNSQNNYNKIMITGGMLEAPVPCGVQVFTLLTTSNYLDRWLNTVIYYDADASIFSLDADGDGVVDYTSAIRADSRDAFDNLIIHGNGWWTGHYVKIDSIKLFDLSVTTAGPILPTALTLTTPTTLQSIASSQLTASATLSDNTSKPVTATWTSSNPAVASVSASGVLTAGSVTSDTTLTVTASYAEGSATRMATHAIALKATPASLDSLSIFGVQGALASGASLYLGARAGYADNSYKPVSSASWSVSDTSAARITAEGVLTAHTVAQATPVLVTATYSEGGATVGTRFQIVVIPNPIPPRFAAEVITRQNKESLTRLQLWFNTQSGASTRALRAGTTFKVFVAAQLPTGALVSQPTWFLLNRNSEWQALSWPLAEYLSGVNDGDWELIELLDAIDTSIISGTQIYIGYGTSDTEMMDAGRYNLVYQVP